MYIYICVCASYVKPTCLQFPAICAKWDAHPSSNNHGWASFSHPTGIMPEPFAHGAVPMTFLALSCCSQIP